MRAITRTALLAYGLAAGIIVLDQIVKAWILNASGLGPGQSAPVWGPFYLTLVQNRGVSFGLFQSDADWTRWALAAFSLVVALVLAGWVRRADKPLLGLAVGLIMGGAVGNLIDRIARGSVTDFVDVQRLHFPWVFNVADSAITVGIVLLMAESLLAPRSPAR